MEMNNKVLQIKIIAHRGTLQKRFENIKLIIKIIIK